MDNFELHQEATRLADTHSPYMLAKMLLIEQKERIELAAHVERLREDVYDQANMILGDFGVRETIDDYLPNSYNEAPATSLAKRDLIKQAEALQQAQQTATEQELSPGLVINVMLEELRQQANQLEISQ